MDATNFVIPGFYLPLLDNNSGDTQFDEIGPAYTTATPAFGDVPHSDGLFRPADRRAFSNILEFSTVAGPIASVISTAGSLH